MPHRNQSSELPFLQKPRYKEDVQFLETKGKYEYIEYRNHVLLGDILQLVD